MFQIKDFPSIVAGMINRARATQSKLTDFNIGSVARTMFEAPAVEIDELYQQMWNGLKESIPIAIYNSFEFSALAATNTVGLMRITFTSSASPILISGGSRLIANDGSSVSFAVISDTTIAPGGTYADVSVIAVNPGVSGNVNISSTFTLSPSSSGFISASALSGFTNGTDAETLAERKVRFIDYVSTLNRGTVSAIKYGASLASVKDVSGSVTEAVRRVVVVEPWLTDTLRPVALVECYIYNGSTGASSGLLDEVLKIINGYTDANGVIVPGWKAAGVKVDIYGAALVSVNVTADIAVSSGYVFSDVSSLVVDAVSDYIANLDIGADVIRAEIIAASMAIPGVENITLSSPASDVAIANTSKAVAGTFSIT